MAQIGLILLNNGKQNVCILLGHKETNFKQTGE